MAFDYLGATKAGYTPEEIAVELKSRGVSMDVSGAKKAGYSDDEIASEINSRFSSIKPQPPEATTPPKVTKKTSGNLLMDTDFSQKPTYTLPKEISEDTKTTAPQKLAKEEEHKDYGRTSRAFKVAKQKSQYGMPTEREVTQAGEQLSAPSPLELDAQGKPTTGGLEAPWVSPEFAGAGAVRAGVAALGKDALKVASGKGFMAGSIGGDVAAWAAHETVDKSLTDEFKQAHPMLSEAMKVSAALVGGVAGGMAAERRYMQQYQTLLDDVKEGVIPPQQAEEVLRQDSGVSEIINKVEETRAKYAEERAAQDEAIAGGINKELYPEQPKQVDEVAPAQQAEQPPLSPLMEKVNAKLQDMGHEPLIKPMPVQAQRVKEAATEIPAGGSEEAAKAKVSEAFKPQLDSEYKKMSAKDRTALEQAQQADQQFGMIKDGEPLDDFGRPLFSKDDLEESKRFVAPESTTTQSVRTIARKFLGKQYNKLKDDLNIVQTFDDLPEDLRKRTGLQTVEVGGKPRGIYDPATGKAHLIADSMTDKEVQSVIAHELLHRHIQSGRQVLGADYDTFVLRLKQLKEDTLVKEAMDAVRSAGTPVKHMNEETMAYLVEKYQYSKDISPKLKRFISDIVEKVKVFIAETATKLGVKPEWLISKMSADEIAQVLKSAAMKSGKVEAETADTLFSKAKQAITDVKQSSQPANVQAVVEKAIKKNIVEKTLDKGIQKVVEGAIKIADVATAHKISGTVSKLIDTEFVKNLIGHKIYQETEYLKLREDALISINRIKDNAMKLHNQLSGLSKEAKEAMHDYMTGYKGEINLTPELKKLADNITKSIDDAGQKLVDEGVLSKEAYEAWKGQYLHRTYTSKLEKAKNIISGRGFTVEGIKQRGKTWEGTTDELYELEKAGSIGKVSEGLIEAETLPNGKVKFRRDWTREERTKMGEVRDAAYTVPETMARLAVLAENSKLLKNIPSHLLLEQGKRTDDEMKELGYTLMRGERYGALNGKWLSNTVADDIKRLGNDMHGDKVAMAYKEYISAIKASHTIYNTVAHVNNTVSNVIMQFTAGLNPVKAIVYASQAVKGLKHLNRLAELESKRLSGLTAKEAAEIAKIESNKTVQLLQEAQELGLFGRSGLADILKEYLEPSLDVADSTLSKVKRAFSSAYEAEDNIMRFSAYKQLKEQGMSPKEAMHKINKDIIPDYTNPISKYARWMRDWGFVPFMSWTYHSTPLILKQIKNNPTRALALIGGIAGIDAAFGINPFDEEDIPQEGFAHQHIVTGREGDKVDTLRISSMLPQSQMIDPWETYVRSILTGGIPQLAVGTIGNHNFYFNKPITRKEGVEGAYQMGKYIMQNILPSPDILDKVYNLAESKVLSKEKRRYDPVIQPKTPAQEAASFFVNIKTYDKAKQRQHAEKEHLK